MNTPKEILAFVGRDNAAAALGVAASRIDRAGREGTLPASWLDALERAANRPLPRDVFNFKHPKGAA